MEFDGALDGECACKVGGEEEEEAQKYGSGCSLPILNFFVSFWNKITIRGKRGKK